MTNVYVFLWQQIRQDCDGCGYFNQPCSWHWLNLKKSHESSQAIPAGARWTMWNSPPPRPPRLPWKATFRTKRSFPVKYIANIAIVVGGGVLNITIFIGENYLAKASSGKSDATERERERLDRAQEAYEAAAA